MKSVAAAFGMLAAASAVPTAQAAESDIVANLQAQIARCWNVPPDTWERTGPVIVRVRLQPDGSLDGVPTMVLDGQLEAPKMLAASALRAVRACAPYRLPADRYAMWKDVQITFKPSNGD